MNKKQTYTSPEVQVFVVQIEDCILTVPSPNVVNAIISSTRTESFFGGDEDYGYEDL